MYCEKCGTQIDENSKFCPNCGNNLTEVSHTETAPGFERNSMPLKKKKSKCLVLSIVFAAIGIIPLLNILFLPIAVILAIKGFVTNKNEITKTKIASVIVVIISIVISLLWMLPALTSSPATPSTGNQNTPTICSHSYALKQTNATCLSGGYATYQCSLCDKTKREYESALGHDWFNNRCTRCSATKDLELDPANNDVLTIEQINWDINSAEGVEPSITCTNQTNKQIAYVYFTLKFYDRMGNPAYCSIRHEHTRILKITGPINAGEKDTYYWDPIIYNGSTAAIKPIKIEVEFTDGTKQTINCTGRFWYSKSYYGGELKD